MKKIIIVSLAVLFTAIAMFAVKGKIAPLSWQLWGEINLEEGVGAGGYDVVSYHIVNKPVVGKEQHSSEWKGAQWYFSNSENKAIFDSNPQNYIPEYGGYCAYAVLKNLTADINPEIWHIENGKLYLFASAGPRDEWVAQITNGAVTLSNQNWAQQ